MTTLSTQDFSHASANAMLAAQTSKVLSGLMRGNQLDPRGRAVVSSAADFLTGIVGGSLLVENRQVAGFAPSYGGLKDYGTALSALQSLNSVSDEASGGDLFVAYRTQLEDLVHQRNVPPDDLAHLRRFFETLSNFFFSDVTRPVPLDGRKPNPAI